MGTRQRQVWAAAQLEGVVTLAYQSGDRATLIEISEDAQVVRVQLARHTPEGWVVTADQQLEGLCQLEVLEGLPLLDDDCERADRPGIARCGFGPSSVDADCEAA